MKLASYKSTRSGFSGISNRLIRMRLKGLYSHTETVFMPGDGVDSIMPDGTCEPLDGAYWCGSAVAVELMPDYSLRRAGRRGGVRLKRIVLDPKKWDLIDDVCSLVKIRHAAEWYVLHQGQLYDWQNILGYLSWLLPEKASRYTCAEAAAAARGSEEAWRFDPVNLHIALNYFNK